MESPELILKSGDFVRVRLKGAPEWTPGRVVLVSTNRKSVGLLLDGAVRTKDGGMIAGALPLSYRPETRTFEGVVTPDEYEVDLVPFGGDE